MKGRTGKGTQAANEAAATSLAQSAGVDVVPVHHVKLNGQDHIVAPKVEGKDLTKFTPDERRSALASVPKQQLDNHALFDYAIGSSDPNHGNYMLQDAGGGQKRMVALDKEQSLGLGTGRSTKANPPYFLGEVVEKGKAATDYTFDRGHVSQMANQAETMAGKLEGMGRKKDAEGVRNRAAVLKQLATGQAEPTVGELMKLGDAADKNTKKGFFGRMFGG